MVALHYFYISINYGGICMSVIDPEDMYPTDNFIDSLNAFGQVLQIHDFKDIGKFDRLHHWQYGFIIEQLSVLLGVFNLSRKLYNGFNEEQKQQKIQNHVKAIIGLI